MRMLHLGLRVTDLDRARRALPSAATPRPQAAGNTSSPTSTHPSSSSASRLPTSAPSRRIIHPCRSGSFRTRRHQRDGGIPSRVDPSLSSAVLASRVATSSSMRGRSDTDTARASRPCSVRVPQLDRLAGRAAADLLSASSRYHLLPPRPRTRLLTTKLCREATVTMGSPDRPAPQGGDRPSIDDLFMNATPVRAAEDLSREGVFDEGEVEEFLADLYAMRRADLA